MLGKYQDGSQSSLHMEFGSVADADADANEEANKRGRTRGHNVLSWGNVQDRWKPSHIRTRIKVIEKHETGGSLFFIHRNELIIKTKLKPTV